MPEEGDARTLAYVKYLNMIMAIILLVFGLLIIVKCVMFWMFWKKNVTFLSTHHEKVAIYFFTVGIFGLFVSIMGISFIYVRDNYKEFVWYVTGLILLFFYAVFMNSIFLHEPTEYDRLILSLRASMNNLNPARLDPIQLAFSCCGVEKYTDYMMLWTDFGGEYKAYPAGKPSKANDSRPAIISQISPAKRSGKPTLISRKGLSKRSRKRKRTKSRPKRSKNELKSNPPKLIKQLRKSKLMFLRIQQNRRRKIKIRTKFYDIPPSRPRPDFIESFTQGLLDLFFNVINRVIRFIFGVKSTIFQFVVGVLSSFYKNFLQWIVPKQIEDFFYYIARLLWSIGHWLGIVSKEDLNIEGAVKMWYWGSGWDDILFQYNMERGKRLLPYSCCKFGHVPCSGRNDDTWKVGCRKVILHRWYDEIGSLIVLIYNFLVATLFTIIVLLIYVLMLKDNRKTWIPWMC